MSTNNKPIIARQSHAVLANVLLVSHTLLLFYSSKSSWNKFAKYEKLIK